MKLLQENNLFFAMGLVVALSVLLVAFEWSSHLPAPKKFDSPAALTQEIEIDLTTHTPEPPKPKIEEPGVVAPDEIEMVEKPVEHQKLFSPEDGPTLPQVASALNRMPPRAEEPVEIIMDFAEISPAFVGGNAALMKFLSENMRYPQVDIEMGNEGRVICTFVVEKDGTITDIRILRGVSPGIDKEAVRVVSEMPKWNPGFQNGKPVRVRFTLPVHFKIAKP